MQLGSGDQDTLTRCNRQYRLSVGVERQMRHDWKMYSTFHIFRQEDRLIHTLPSEGYYRTKKYSQDKCNRQSECVVRNGRHARYLSRTHNSKACGMDAG